MKVVPEKTPPVDGIFSPSEVFSICAKIPGFLHFMRERFFTL